MTTPQENLAGKTGRPRRWIRVTVDSLVLLLLAAIVFDAYYYEPNHPQVEAYPFPTAKWPEGQKPIRVAQLSDLHLSSYGKREQRVIRALNELNPEVVVMTGDYFGRKSYLPVMEKFLSQLPPAAIKIAVMGNVEHSLRIPPQAYEDLFARFQVQLLINSKVYLQMGKARICVVGLDDTSSGFYNPNLLHGLAPDDFNLVLAHSPEIFSLVRPNKTPNIDLILTGHTHGGQIRIPVLPAFWLPKDTDRYGRGFYRKYGVAMYLNRGIGTTVFPARFNCRPEIAVFELGAKP